MPHHSEYKPVPDHLKVQEMLSNCKVMSSKATLQVSVKALFTERMTFFPLVENPFYIPFYVIYRLQRWFSAGY